jgi:hypothetical protein
LQNLTNEVAPACIASLFLDIELPTGRAPKNEENDPIVIKAANSYKNHVLLAMGNFCLKILPVDY